MIQSIKNLTLPQKNSTSQTVQQQKTKQKNKTKKNNSIKFDTKSTKSSLGDYSDAYILVTVDITVNTGGENGSDKGVGFKNCAPFSTCKADVNVVFIDGTNHIYIAMSMYNLTEYSDNYSDTSGSLWQFKRDEAPANDVDLTINNSKSFEYKGGLVAKISGYGNPNSFVRKQKNSCSIKMQFFEITTNVINQL